MTMPNFLIVGAAKAGTTSLVHYLQQHPQIYFSPRKEPRFFAFEEGETLNFTGPNDYLNPHNASGNNPGINNTSVTTLEAYQKLFKGVTNETAIGEASTIYLYSEKAPNRIKQYIPETKIIIILRNPIERAYSSYLHLVRDGYENLTFEEGLQSEESRIKDNWSHLWHYTKSGFYYDQVSRYYKYFSPSQIKIYTNEELSASPESVLLDIYDFIKVENSFIPDFETRLNQSGAPRNRLFHKLLTKDNAIKKGAKMVIPKFMRKQVYASLKQRNLGPKPDIKPHLRERLGKLFEQDLIRLQDLSKKDLTSWIA